ncbi:DUF4401 domain-containing protein [Lewinella sp. IMCC34183]|uniref:DUF4401 domain-containing protein n=1 Tax=Lewinella sp. IMCC34183 TaxID=2248762 RepID=UPI0013009B2C|nr:DUF4401 domain-containing protein [Lewinella sp. IMCC34183]
MLSEGIARWRARASVPFTVDEAALAADAGQRDDDDTDQAVRVLSGLGGVLSSLIFLLFLWITDLFTRPVVAVPLGVALIVTTLALGRTRRQAFLATTTVCGYLVGVGLIMVGLPPQVSDSQLVWPVLLIAAATVAGTRNYYLVFLAVVSVPACLLYLHLVQREPAWVWAAVLLAALGVAGVTYFEHFLIADRRMPPLRSGLVCGLLLTLVWFRWGEWMVPGGGHLNVAVVPFAGSLYLLLLSFRNQHALGAGLGVAGLAYFTVQYYYDLRWTLLDKSLILMAAGALLLVAWALLRRNRSAREDA